MLHSVRLLFLVSVLLFASNEINASGPRTATLASQNHSVQIQFSQTPGGIEYKLLFHKGVVLHAAPVKIAIRGDDDDAQVLQLGNPERYVVNQFYAWNGVHSTVRIHAEGMRLPVIHDNGKVAYTIDVRAFDSGVAFRLLLPGEPSRVPQETIGFYPTSQSVIWSFDPGKDFYEGIYQSTKMTALPKGHFAAPPVVIELPDDGGYLAITESNLKHFYGMVLQSDGDGKFQLQRGSDVPPDKPFLDYHGSAEAERLSIPVPMQGAITTPWRVVMVASTLNDLVNNDIVSSLADPPDHRLFQQGVRTPWIKPGRAVWLYLDGGAWTFDGAKEFSKLAGELGFEYQVIEDQWEEWSDKQLKDLVTYSKERGVGIWVWKNRKDLQTRESRNTFFERCNRAGVVGAKIDYFDSESLEVVDLAEEILREAAQHHLMVDFHGANKPTGEQRTWPNELTREGVEGLEHADAPRVTHEVTIPFTRLLAGPADYTPVIFDKGLNGTTWANQIASAVILTSPLLNFAANPTTLVNNPAVSVIRAIPSVWDETIVLPPSKIGELAIFARRSGKVWFLAVLNGTGPRSLDIPLTFLGNSDYVAETVGDVPLNPTSVAMHHGSYRGKDSIRVTLSDGGGFVAKFSRP